MDIDIDIYILYRYRYIYIYNMQILFPNSPGIPFRWLAGDMCSQIDQ
jgi:hypothetical protein